MGLRHKEEPPKLREGPGQTGMSEVVGRKRDDIDAKRPDKLLSGVLRIRILSYFQHGFFNARRH
jgi:hypothetical protein